MDKHRRRVLMVALVSGEGIRCTLLFTHFEATFGLPRTRIGQILVPFRPLLDSEDLPNFELFRGAQPREDAHGGMPGLGQTSSYFWKVISVFK